MAVPKPPIDESKTAANYTVASSVPDVSLQFEGQALPRNINAYTGHWWGKNADGSLIDNFDSVVNNFCNGSLQTSAHFVVEAGRWACLVSPPDAAWACGNWEGNRTTVSIEMNPRQSDGDYLAAAWLLAWLRNTEGDFPIVPHNHWVQTECPGTYDLARLDNMAREITAGTLDPTNGASANTPTNPQEDDVPYLSWPQADKDALVNDIFNKQFVRQGVDPKAYNNPDVNLGAVVSWFDAAHVADRSVITAAIEAAEQAILSKISAAPAVSGSVVLSDADKEDIANKVVAAEKAQWTK